MVTNLENFILNFPNSATREDKALLMAATLFADYRFFEKRKDSRGNAGGGM